MVFVQQDCTKITPSLFTKFGGKAVHEPQKKPLDFGSNPDHVTLGLRLGLGLQSGRQVIPAVTVTILPDDSYKVGM